MPKKDLSRELRVLDLEQGGIFPVLKRSIVEGISCLIISYGGTGSDALEVVKRNLERNMDKEEMDKYVRLLAIDTATETRTKKVSVKNSDGTESMTFVDRFTPREWFWLDNAPGRQAVSLYNSDGAMKQWINPKLPDAINATPGWLDGNGASSTRQLGRVLLYPQETVIKLRTKIETLVREITNNNNNTLEVFIISGISGGTGSGIVVDATYLIRDIITPMAGGIGSRTHYYGFLMLPPTGLSENPIDIAKGNRNGIAALKEIDHFMTIAYRDEEYAANFAGKRIVSKENIFENCYLIDGGHGSMAISNPRAKANEVVSDCILDILTSQPAEAINGQTTQSVASFMSDVVAFSKQMVSNNSEQLAPRNANYVYCAIGHGKTLIPIELMKAYVAKLSFDEVYKLFKKSSQVQEADIEDFVTKEIWVKPFNTKEQIKALRSGVDERFKNPRQGPFYCVNFLKAVAEYAGDKYNDVKSKAIVLNKQEKLDHYACIQQEALRLNNRYFNTYTRVLDEMKNYLQDQYGIICDSKRLQDYSGSTYTFTPIDFSGNDEKAMQVQTYLNGLVSDKKTKGLIAKGLIIEMINHRDEWTELETQETVLIPKFNAGVRIRRFWNEQINKIVSATLEDFLVKYYSNDPEAEYKEVMTDQGKQPTPESEQYMTEAANAIVRQMWGGAGVATPLAELHTAILPMDNFNGHNLFLVPRSAPHLRKYIQNALDNNNIKNVTVLESYADDRLSCYSQYTGLPAYMFKWVHRAEPNYEDAINTADIGLHMSETKGGEHWQNYPNLLVEGIWDKLNNPPYENPREAAIGRQADDLFNRSKALGLTFKKAVANQANVDYYTLSTLPERYRPDTALFKEVDTEKDGSDAKRFAEARLAEAIEQKAEELFKLENWARFDRIEMQETKEALRRLNGEPVKFNVKELQFVNSVMTPLLNMADPVVPKGWEEKLAAQLMRECPAYMFEVRGTVLVLESLFAKIREAQNSQIRKRAFAHFLAADLFFYDEKLLTWNYLDNGVEKPLCEMDYGVEVQQYAKYYFVYGAFEQEYNAYFAALMPSYQDLVAAQDRAEKIQKLMELKEKATARVEEINKALKPDRTNLVQESIITTLPFRKAAEKRGYDADAIIELYQDLLTELNQVPDPNF